MFGVITGGPLALCFPRDAILEVAGLSILLGQVNLYPRERMFPKGEEPCTRGGLYSHRRTLWSASDRCTSSANIGKGKGNGAKAVARNTLISAPRSL